MVRDFPHWAINVLATAIKLTEAYPNPQGIYTVAEARNQLDNCSALADAF